MQKIEIIKDFVLIRYFPKCLATVTTPDLRRSLEKNLNTPIKEIANYNFQIYF